MKPRYHQVKNQDGIDEEKCKIIKKENIMNKKIITNNKLKPWKASAFTSLLYQILNKRHIIFVTTMVTLKKT